MRRGRGPSLPAFRGSVGARRSPVHATPADLVLGAPSRCQRAKSILAEQQAARWRLMADRGSGTYGTVTASSKCSTSGSGS